MSGKRASAVIINKGKILLVHRIKNDREYFVLPGGSVEKGESKNEAVVREVKEETGLDVKINKKLWKHKDNFDPRTQYVFLITNITGILSLGDPEIHRQSKDNKYILEWRGIEGLKNINLVPEEIKTKILKMFSGDVA